MELSFNRTLDEKDKEALKRAIICLLHEKPTAKVKPNE